MTSTLLRSPGLAGSFNENEPMFLAPAPTAAHPTKVVGELWQKMWEGIMRKVKTKNGQELLVPEKGERHKGSGRRPGLPNSTTRTMKEAIILAAEQSKHSKTGDLVGYLLFLADDHPELFAPFLGRLLPLQINAKTERSVKVTYRTVEEVRAALIARGLAPERVDLLLIGKVPEPVEVLGDVEKSEAE
jgi:hypothetical protein